MRREGRLTGEDRIRVSVEAHGEVAAAIEEHSPYICGETLAVELRCGAPPGDWMARAVDLEESRVNVAVTRAWRRRGQSPSWPTTAAHHASISRRAAQSTDVQGTAGFTTTSVLRWV